MLLLGIHCYCRLRTRAGQLQGHADKKQGLRIKSMHWCRGYGAGQGRAARLQGNDSHLPRGVKPLKPKVSSVVTGSGRFRKWQSRDAALDLCR